MKKKTLWNDKNWHPMLLSEIDNPFDSKDYLYEIKFDGIRAIIFVNNKQVIIKSRYGQDLTHLYPELQSIKELVKHNTIFDGEIIALDNGYPSFSKLQARLHLKNITRINCEQKDNPVIYIAFDILYEDKDLTDLTLLKRKNILNSYKDNDVFIKSKVIYNNGIELFKKIKKLNLEGIVAKKKDSIYEINTRSSNWIKIKNIKMDDFIIGGFINNKNNTVSLLLGEFQNNKLYYVGKVVMSNKKDGYNKLLKYKINKSPFIDYNEKNINYLNPKIICEIEYLERTKNNHLRHPVFRKIKDN